MDVPFSPGSGNSLMSLLLAAVVPFLCLRAFTFLFHAWPNFFYRWLTSYFDRQVAMVMARVNPNRVIQDDVMIRSIMGYVSYCYARGVQRGADACDAVATADYEYSFLFDKSDMFEEDWVPYSPRFRSLFGRVIASCMQLSVVPSHGHSIQVEPGLFVRFLPNRYARGGGRDEDGRWSEESQQSSECPNRGKRPGAAAGELNQVDKLNMYMFYSMRRYAQNMDDHPEPCVDGRADALISEERPFDPGAQSNADQGRGGGGGSSNSSTQSESTFFEDPKQPPEEHIVVLEYRRPLPHEHSQALCNSSDTHGGASKYDASQSAEDMIEGFLGRVHRWYLGHVAQRKRAAPLVIYPSLLMAQLKKMGTVAPKMHYIDPHAEFSGKYYVLESAALGSEESMGAAAASSASFSVKAGTKAGDSTIVTAARKLATTPTGGHVGLRGAELSSESRGKTFNSLFFPGKTRVLSMIDDFVEERGRFGVPGVVPRLTFFLYGAPGTGKTSFVKALARHLRRNLVVVSMSEIITVNELQRVLQPFDMELREGGESRSRDAGSLSVCPHQSVYVFEDFDAIGDAWEALIKMQARQRKLAEERQLGKSTKSSGGKVRGSDDGDGGKSQAASPSSSAGSRSGESFDSHEDDGSDSDDGDSECRDTFLLRDSLPEELTRDHLTVERFIDLFNGLNLPDSFIAVFTTNHPERINPLIASSSVMDVTLNMGMLDEECATQMVEHYYAAELDDQTVDGGGRRHLSISQLEALRAALRVFNVGSTGLSGALLEKMCVECDTVAALTARLRSVDSSDSVDVF
ncbi:conserved hypothetical protein [Leishmania major strain Friedlin]|uniref:AAA+ ATPase domain-containing protein n=1 Tax=Leishmania major TaxID=5664 RepID=Q4Q3H4_LEIMA|nr:conserved hypothetical protein [Leishmania major strain Friedlin]CAG9581771.1 AAA_domain_(dynein-related_subfamily)/ATPase_family_associated_with_various_cellular_activities_(AAA)/AAA_domain_containing_protein_-_putative [Leishmania major strain Friedlin]CAJ07735.1 conserved hypothetical protein [Leishmania major strain Friedlin]|eukprot:XP_001686124.1 conserved hypothetical protein [Leishmania major strain Friedlin]